VAADAEHQDEADGRRQVHGRQVAASHARRIERCRPHVLRPLAEPSRLHGLGAKALHDAHARDGLLDHRGQIRRPGLHRHHGRMDAAREPLGEDVDERQRQERAERQSRVQGQEDHGDARGQGDVRHRERDHDDEHLHLLQVVAGPAHELAGLRLVVEADVEGLQVGEEPLPEPRLRPTGLAEGDIPPRRAQDAGHEAESDDGQRPHEERVVAVDRAVDGATDQEGDHDLRAAPRQTDHATQRDALPLRGEGAAEQPPTLPTARRRQWTSFSRSSRKVQDR
jgi:hypothetical protein